MIQLSNEEYAALVGERDALTVKTTSLESALKRAHDLILHIEDVLPDESFDLIDTMCWNAATSDMRGAPGFPHGRTQAPGRVLHTLIRRAENSEAHQCSKHQWASDHSAIKVLHGYI